MNLGSRIKELRKERDITQEKMGNDLNIAKSTISQYENNINTPDTEMLNRLATYFEVSVDYLLGRTSIRLPAEQIIKNSQVTTALHRTDGYDDDLPEEARQAIEEFKAYIRNKYKKK